MTGKERKKKEKKKEKPVTKVHSEPPEKVTEVTARKHAIPETDIFGDFKTDVGIPDLPTRRDSSHANVRKETRLKSKQQVIASVPVEKASKRKSREPDEPAFTYYDFGDMASTHEDNAALDGSKMLSYLNDRPVLSLQSSRFELPMDIKTLESIEPQEYLRKYCIISARRKSLYSKIFLKYREKSGGLKGKQRLCNALKDVLVNTMSDDQADDLCNLLEIDDDTAVDLKLFSGVAALAERILYPDFITDDMADKTEYQREKLECADFHALRWKLHNVEISSHVRKLLESLG